jgi:hypothetical protein
MRWSFPKLHHLFGPRGEQEKIVTLILILIVLGFRNLNGYGIWNMKLNWEWTVLRVLSCHVSLLISHLPMICTKIERT